MLMKHQHLNLTRKTLREELDIHDVCAVLLLQHDLLATGLVNNVRVALIELC